MKKRHIFYLTLMLGLGFFLMTGLPSTTLHTHYRAYQYFNQLKKGKVVVCFEGGAPQIVSHKGHKLDTLRYPLLIIEELK